MLKSDTAQFKNIWRLARKFKSICAVLTKNNLARRVMWAATARYYIRVSILVIACPLYSLIK